MFWCEKIMFEEQIGNEFIVTQAGTSEGTQIKYRKGKYWYKKDSRGKEGLAEYLSSKLLTYNLGITVPAAAQPACCFLFCNISL